MVLDLALVLAMFVMCGGIGLPLAQLLPERFAWRVLIALSLGLAVLAVAVPIAYRSGLSINCFFFAAIVLAVCGLAWRVRPTWQALRALSADERRVAMFTGGALALATLVMLAPRWVGGDQFAVFQGNHWDTFGYLESAIGFARKPHAFLETITDEQMMRAPILAIAHTSLTNRPSAHQLYAVFSRIAPGEAYRLYYPFLVVGFVQLAMVMTFVLRNAFPSMRRWAWIAIALAFPLGFWGQYIFDINAWSQIASQPLLFLAFGLGVHALARPESELRAAARIAGVIAIAVAGAAYLYPEGLLIYGAAIALVAIVVAIVRLVRARKLAPVVPLFGFAGIASVLLYAPQLAFLMKQVKWSAGNKVDWWKFHQGFFCGRDGELSHGFAMASDFAGGFFGLYFATPARGAGMVIGTAHRTVIVVLIAGVLMGVALLLANKLRATREERLHAALWTAITVVAFLPAVRLVLDENYWPAGKIVSYAAPLVVTLLCIPVGFASELRAWKLIRVAGGAFVAFQLATGLARIVGAARAPDGIHYALPYPSVQAVELKRDLPWDLSPLEAVTPGTKLLLRPMDLFAQGYLMSFLYSRRIPFAIDGKINTHFGLGREFPPVPPPWEPDAEVTVGNRKIVVTYRDPRPFFGWTSVDGLAPLEGPYPTGTYQLFAGPGGQRRDLFWPALAMSIYSSLVCDETRMTTRKSEAS